MIIKTINLTLDVLVALSVWCAAVMFAVFIAIMARHAWVEGGLAAYSWLHS